MLTVNPTTSTLWEFEPVDPRLKFERVGEAVRPNEAVLLKHVYTCHCLGTDHLFFK